MRVQDVMSEQVRTVTVTTTADEAWNLMRLHRIHHLVVAEGSRIAGIVSERDLGGPRGATMRKHRTVADLMTPNVVTVPPTTTVRTAANLMRGRSIGCVVVGRPRRVMGIVTTADLLALIGRGDERPVASTTRWALRHRTPHRKQHRAAGVW
jgi:CBS-domain-containing membrane protein